MLKKVYFEITNVCGLSCSFCHGTKREKSFITVENFRAGAEKIRPYTEYLYLHLMGEPLLHPALADILGVCSDLGFRTVITTGGFQLAKKGDILLDSSSLYKVSVSLHSYEANENLSVSLSDYIGEVCAFAEKAAAKGVKVSLRLWNEGGENSRNAEIEALLAGFFKNAPTINRRGLTLAENVYLEYGEKFDWPDINEKERAVRFCMGLRDHIGVLCDGTVVPCCLDSEGSIPLGSIFTDSLKDILQSEKAKAIYDGFSRGKAAEELCRHCGYAEKFNKRV